MKKFLLGFVFGIGLPLLVAVVTGLWFLNTPGEKKTNVVDTPAVTSPPPSLQEIHITGTALIPESLKKYQATHPGLFNIWAMGPIMSGDKPGRMISVHPVGETISRPSLPAGTGFPAKFDLAFYESELARFGPEGATLLVRVDYCFTQGMNCQALDPRVSARVMVPIRAKFDKRIDLGNIYMTRFLPQGGLGGNVPCGKNVLTGKVVATEEYMAKAPPGKKVLVFIPTGSGTIRVPGANDKSAPFQNYAYQATEIVPSTEGVSFSLPLSKLPEPDYVSGFVAHCNSGEGTWECAERAYAAMMVIDKSLNVGIRLVPKDFELPHCSGGGPEHPVTYYLHWYPPRTMPSKPVFAKDRNSRAPAEIIEGQAY